MDAVNAAHGTYTLVIEPHIAKAIWAIVLAIACALVVFIADMVKQHNDAPAEARRHRSKKPPR